MPRVRHVPRTPHRRGGRVSRRRRESRAAAQRPQRIAATPRAFGSLSAPRASPSVDNSVAYDIVLGKNRVVLMIASAARCPVPRDEPFCLVKNRVFLHWPSYDTDIWLYIHSMVLFLPHSGRVVRFLNLFPACRKSRSAKGVVKVKVGGWWWCVCVVCGRKWWRWR